MRNTAQYSGFCDDVVLVGTNVPLHPESMIECLCDNSQYKQAISLRTTFFDAGKQNLPAARSGTKGLAYAEGQFDRFGTNRYPIGAFE